MKVGDIVRWSGVEEAYHLACIGSGASDLTDHRKCGIIIDRNPYVFFVYWQNGDFLAQKPNTIEVIRCL